MSAISFDLITSERNKSHPRRVNRAYDESRKTMARYGFICKQGSVYLNPGGGLVQLAQEMEALRALPWLPAAARETRTFRLGNNSGFTGSVKERRS